MFQRLFPCLLALVAGASACGSDHPTGGTKDTNLEGTWSGPYSVESYNGTLTLILTQAGSTVNGSILINGTDVDGNLTGTVIGDSLAFEIAYPPDVPEHDTGGAAIHGGALKGAIEACAPDGSICIHVVFRLNKQSGPAPSAAKRGTPMPRGRTVWR